MSEAYVQIEKLLSEVKSRVLNVPCPECGGVPDKPAKPGETIKCKYCGSYYNIESGLNKTSTEAIKNFVTKIIDDTVSKFNISFGNQLNELTDLLQSYLNQVLEETRNFYNKAGRLPQQNELDKMLEKRTEQILNTIASFSKQLLNGQETISVKVDTVMGRVDSIRIGVSEIKRLLERIELAYGKDWHETKSVEATLLYSDAQNQTRKLKFTSITIGRQKGSWELEARYPNGNTQPLNLMDPTVSKNHIKIQIRDGIATLMDLGSKNGTYINGRKIEQKTPIKLHDGDEIQIGLNTKFKIYLTQK